MTLLFSLMMMMMMMMVCVATSTVGSCNSQECLQFELLCRTEDYEVRRYSATRWISTDAEAYFLGVGAAMAFRRLYHYISGDNKEGVKFELTAPVLVEVPEERKMWEPAIYTLSFLLPSAYQERPPTPTNDKLYFSDMPDMDVYVRCYGGWMLSITSQLHAHLLTKALLRANAQYNHTHHYAVGYDSPLKLLNRHNEVWYVVEGDPVCGHNLTSNPADAH
ncbi:heme-binding protein 2 [Myxocyprinus asiaticus]|uniref:heme-binding protein 2 n=1 Tax=Myxocyprinus asiaticus TaxID=70543 RepID=UPI0022217686|nr:heme-binding protein 2 [Myxocyprinus asiaticus]